MDIIFNGVLFYTRGDLCPLMNPHFAAVSHVTLVGQGGAMTGSGLGAFDSLAMQFWNCLAEICS